MTERPMLNQLMDSGCTLAIKGGELVVKKPNGDKPPEEWIKTHATDVIDQIIKVTSCQNAYRCFGHSVTPYKSEGTLTLMFADILTDTDTPLFFNVYLSRKRKTNNSDSKKLPKGKFRVTERCQFKKFWKKTELKDPGNSSYHDYMGKLKKLIYYAEKANGTGKVKEKINPESVTLLDLSYEQIQTAYLRTKTTDNSPEKPTLNPANDQVKFTDNQTTQSQHSSSLQVNQTTYPKNHDYTLKGNAIDGTRDHYHYQPSRHVPPQEQSNEQWLDDYSKAAKFPNDFG